MVKAGWPVNPESTLAARPVEASRTVGILTAASERTRAPITDVFPVPAYPLRMKTESLGVKAEQ